MKKIILAAASVVSIALAPMATAQTWTGGSVLEWEGSVIVQKGDAGAFPCTLNVKIVNPGSGSTTTTDGVTGVQLSAGFFACDLIGLGVQPGPIPSPQPFNVSYTNVGGVEKFTLHNVYAVTPTPGDCQGDISATLDDSTDDLLVSTFLPEVANGDCTINGTLSLVSGGPLNIF